MCFIFSIIYQSVTFVNEDMVTIYNLSCIHTTGSLRSNSHCTTQLENLGGSYAQKLSETNVPARASCSRNGMLSYSVG